MKKIKVQQPQVFPLDTTTQDQQVYPITTAALPPKKVVAGKDNPLGQRMLKRVPRPPFVIPGLRPKRVGMMVAPGGTGKSYAVLQMAMSIATGLDVFGFENMGHQVQQGNVLYFSFEDDADDIGDRLHFITNAYPVLQTQKAVDDIKNLTLHCGNKGDMDLMAHYESNQYQDLLKKCQGHALVIVDTLAQSHTGEENSSSDMGQLIGNLHRLARDSGCAILVLHHASKAAILNGLGTTAEAARGSGTLIASIRLSYFMARMDDKQAKGMGITNPEDYVEFGTSKQNHIKGMSNYWYQSDSVGVLMPKTLTPARPTTKPKKKLADIIDAKILGDKYAE